MIIQLRSKQVFQILKGHMMTAACDHESWRLIDPTIDQAGKVLEIHKSWNMSCPTPK